MNFVSQAARVGLFLFPGLTLASHYFSINPSLDHRVEAFGINQKLNPWYFMHSKHTHTHTRAHTLSYKSHMITPPPPNTTQQTLKVIDDFRNKAGRSRLTQSVLFFAQLPKRETQASPARGVHSANLIYEVKERTRWASVKQVKQEQFDKYEWISAWK